MIRKFFKERAKSFGYAFKGIGYTITTQKNAWIHTLATILVILLSFLLSIDTISFIILLIMIGFVWTAECFNTAIETVVNLASPDYHNLAKTTKDVSAGAVLVASLTAAVVGFLILGPPLMQVLVSFFVR